MEATPAPRPKSPNNPSIIVRNILVGAVTTIIGSTTVYFITRKDPGPSETERRLVMKEATIGAWKSFVTFENLYTKKSLVLTDDVNAGTINLDEYINMVNVESKKFTGSIEELITKKNIDKDLVQALKSRLENEKPLIPMLSKIAATQKSLVDTNLSNDEKLKLYSEAAAKWVAQNKSYTERAIADIEDVAKILTQQYGENFSMTDFIVYNIVKKAQDSIASLKNNPVEPIQKAEPVVEKLPELAVTKALITGRWSANPPNGADIDFTNSGKFYWHVLSNGDHISGTWKLADGKLGLYPVNEETGKKATWIFELSQVKKDQFIMKLTIKPFNSYSMNRQQPK